MYLPAIIRRSTGQYSEGYAAIASELGLKDTPEALAALIEEYADMLGLPLKLCELERDKNAFLKKLPLPYGEGSTVRRSCPNYPG